MSREDLIGQMQGLREELAHAEQFGRSDRADAVRAYMETVRAAGACQADALDAEASRLEAVGQHMGAGQRREGAAALRAGLGIRHPVGSLAEGEEPDDTETGPEPAGEPETTADTTPTTKAVPKKATRRTGSRKGG